MVHPCNTATVLALALGPSSATGAGGEAASAGLGGGSRGDDDPSMDGEAPDIDAVMEAMEAETGEPGGAGGGAQPGTAGPPAPRLLPPDATDVQLLRYMVAWRQLVRPFMPL